MNIGFTGSREWGDVTKHARRKTILALDYIAQKYPDSYIHVGDAFGVDKWVVDRCLELDHIVVVYGINHKWRNCGERAQFESKVSGLVNCNGSYLDRDRYMVDGLDLLVAIWNGVSRGTKYTFDYAKKQGKKVHIATLTADGWKWNITE